jgi:hypothetical protein
MDRWLNVWPDSRKTVEPLVAAARAEIDGGVRGRHYRELFRLIRDTLTRAVPEAAPAGPTGRADERGRMSAVDVE